jgi:hypothetical protein
MIVEAWVKFWFFQRLCLQTLAEEALRNKGRIACNINVGAEK